MYSNANILPVAAEDLKTQFNEQAGEYTKKFSFGSIESKHMAVYIGFIVGLVALYLVYRILITNFLTLLKKLFKNKKIFDESQEAVDDFYSVVSFSALSALLKDD